METANYSLQPIYNEPKPGEQRRATGFAASNMVEVQTKQMDQLGRIIDVAIGAGANRVAGIDFRLAEDQAVYAEALKLAAQRAKAKAETLAEALGVKIAGIRSAQEFHTQVQPFRAEMASMAAAGPTPIEPQMIEIRASVTLVVAISSP
jgi:uncharacterized protein YggE